MNYINNKRLLRYRATLPFNIDLLLEYNMVDVVDKGDVSYRSPAPAINYLFAE